jgi:hypothetical protein
MTNPIPIPRAPWSVPRNSDDRLKLLKALEPVRDEDAPDTALTGKILTCVEGALTEVAVTVTLEGTLHAVTVTAWRLYCLGWLDEAPSLSQLAREISRELVAAWVCEDAQVRVKGAGLVASASSKATKQVKVTVNDKQFTLLGGGGNG